MKNALNECISNQQFIRFYAKKGMFFLVLLLCIVVLILPGFFRLQNSSAGDDGYYYFRIANQLKDNTLARDEFSFGGRNNFLPLGWAYILAGTSYFSGLDVESVSRILLFLLGIGSLILFYLILENYDHNFRLITSSILVLSPAFIYLFSINNRFAFPVFLTLLIFYLSLNERYLLAVLFSLLIPFFGFLNLLFVGLFFLSYFFYKKKRIFRKTLFIFFILLLISSFINFYLNWVVGLGVELSLLSFISDFGPKYGFSFFTFLLVCFGLLFFWRKRDYAFFYITGIILFLISFKIDWLIFYLNFIVCFLAGLSFLKLYNRKWESSLVGKLTLWILVCGIVFSGVSYLSQFDNFKPNDELFIALDEIPNGAVVLSHYSNGYWLEYSGKKTFMDPFFSGVSDLNERKKDANDIFYSKDIEKTKNLLDKYNIEYIFIDKDMRNGKVWTKSEEGLLFLLEVSPSFESIYKSDNFMIWRYLKENGTS